MFCGNCGNQIPDNASFCPRCGTRVTVSGGSSGRTQASPGTPPPPYQPPAPSYGAAHITTDRNLLTWFLLTLVTCGIYGYYFTYKLAQDLNTMCVGDGEETPGLLAFVLLSFFTCGIYAYWWYYRIGNRLQRNAPRYGLYFQENGTTILLWQIFGALLCFIGPFVAMHIIIKNTNAMAAAYNVRAGV